MTNTIIKDLSTKLTIRHIVYLYLFIFIVSSKISSQNKNTFTCGYNTSTKPDFCNFIYDKKYINDIGVVNRVKSIVDLIGLPQNFILVECSNVNNAYAFLSPTGTRYIVIDSQWLTAIGSKNWFILGILAHEIGHHLCGHTSINKELSYLELQKQELEADKFAGFILQGLGATLDQSLSAINTLIPNEVDDTFSTHPSRSKRIAAIKNGYNKSNPISANVSTATPSAEEYFNLAYNTVRDPSIYTSSDLLLKALGYYEKALKLNPNFVDALLNEGVIFTFLGENKTFTESLAWDGAMICYKRLLEINPNDIGTLNNIGQMYSSAAYKLQNSKYYDEALKYFTACINLDKNFSMAYLNRGIVYLNYGYTFRLALTQKACSDFYIACKLGESKACSHYNNACR